MKKFSKVTGYKLKLHKLKAFLYTNNKQTKRKRDYGHTLPFTIASEEIKYLNLTKEVKTSTINT